MTQNILRVNNLETSFFTHVGEIKAIRGISLTLSEGETLGIVGESGSGKSVTSLSVMGLLPFGGKVVNGQIMFKDKDILKYSKRKMRSIRGNEIAMIFQDPMTSLNPLYTIGNQLIEAILEHNDLTKKQAKEKAIEMLKMVGIPSPEDRINNYPYEFSGGMRQRAMIAMALSCNPKLLIADEPTTALDVTIQAQILKLIKGLNQKLDMATIFITHDLGVVANVCNRMAVMYGGLIMEEGSNKDIFYSPQHPYTMGLLQSIPKVSIDEKAKLVPILGSPIDLLNPPKGCPFYNRCKFAMNICYNEQPPYFFKEDGHRAMCWLLDDNAPKIPAYESQKGGVRSGS